MYKLYHVIYILYAIIYMCELLSHVQLFQNPWTLISWAPLSMEFSSKNTGVGSHSLLQEIFPTKGSNVVSQFVGRFFTI